MTKTHTIALFAFDQCQLLDVAGPSSVFGVANSIASRVFYEVKVISPHGGLIGTSCGVSLATLTPNATLSRTIDTVLVAGGGLAAMRGALKRRRHATGSNAACNPPHALDRFAPASIFLPNWAS